LTQPTENVSAASEGLRTPERFDDLFVTELPLQVSSLSDRLRLAGESLASATTL
jgi:hypothetical protein